MKRELPFAILYAVFALVLTAMFVREPAGLRNGNPRCQFEPMIEGTANRPYVYRALLPVTIRKLSDQVSEEQRLEFNRAFIDNGHFIGRTLDSLVPGWDREYTPEYILALAFIALGFFAFGYALRYLASGVFELPLIVRQLLPVAAFTGLPPTFEPYGSYLYDSFVLFLFTLGLALMIRRRWLAYLVCFALACLNKETTILLAVIFFLHFGSEGRLEKRTFWQLLLAQLAIFGAIRLGLQHAYADNPGDPVEFHLVRNLLRMPRFTIASTVAMFVVGGLVVRNWRDKPPFLRTTISMLVPLLVLTFFLGYLDELRDYYEVYPAALLLVLPTALPSIGLRIRHRETDAGRAAILPGSSSIAVEPAE